MEVLMAHTLARADERPRRRVRPPPIQSVSPAAPLGSIRRQKQVQAGEKEEGERGHRQEAHPSAVLLLCHRNAVLWHDIVFFLSPPKEYAMKLSILQTAGRQTGVKFPLRSMTSGQNVL
jgi:hypothetical protein